MSRERFDSVTARIPARIQSALSRGRELAETRRLSHEQGSRGFMEGDMQDGVEVILPVDPRARECLDTRAFAHQVALHNDVYNASVSRQWREDPNPREDAWSPKPSRIDPSS